MTSIAFQRDLPRRINKWLRRCKEIKRGNGCQTQEDGRDSRKSACSGLTVRSDLSVQPNYRCYTILAFGVARAPTALSGLWTNSNQIKSNLFTINKVHNITVHKSYISLGWTDRRQLRTYVCP